MGEVKTVTALVLGGEASAGPPLGPSLGPLGVNVMAIVKEINEKTKDYGGMRVPVKVAVDTETKSFTVEIGVPTTSALLVKESGAMIKGKDGKDKPGGSGSPKANLVGNITMDQLIGVASNKLTQSYGKSISSVVKEVVGTCISMGIKVEGKDPREVMREILEGKITIPEG